MVMQFRPTGNPTLPQDDPRGRLMNNGGTPPVSQAYQEAVNNPGVFTVSRLRELSQNPQQLAGHDDWAAATTLYNEYKRLFGTEPTQEDVNRFVPTYLQNANLGNQQLADYKTAYDKSPEQLAKKAPEQYGSVDQLFQSTLGRAATDQEKTHFGQLLSTGDTDAYTLQSFLQNLPEYRSKKDEEFRGGLRSELASSDARYFNEQVMPGIQSNFAKSGRSVDSSGFASALAQAASAQNQDRERYLAGLSADQYSGRTNSARADYESYVNRLYGNQDYNRARTDGLSDQYRQRTYQLEDFNLQKQAYDDYLRKYGRRDNSGWAGAALGAFGAAVGGMKGGAPGAQAGWQIGSGLGNSFGG